MSQKYKVYQALEPYVFKYRNVYGEWKEVNIEVGQMIYEGISYDQGQRMYYFDKKAGNGGNPVATIKEIENEERFKFIRYE